MSDFEQSILKKMDESYKKAMSSLVAYKFWMFGYHAAAWVRYNQLLPKEVRRASPFRPFVEKAREMILEETS